MHSCDRQHVLDVHAFQIGRSVYKFDPKALISEIAASIIYVSSRCLRDELKILCPFEEQICRDHAVEAL